MYFLVRIVTEPSPATILVTSASRSKSSEARILGEAPRRKVKAEERPQLLEPAHDWLQSCRAGGEGTCVDRRRAVRGKALNSLSGPARSSLHEDGERFSPFIRHIEQALVMAIILLLEPT
jgi:hypothetical protein